MKLRKTLRIARWEVAKGAGTLDRATVAFAVLAVVLGAIAGPAAVSSVTLDEGIYRVGVEESSPYHDVVEQHEQLVAGSPDGELGEEISVRVTDEGFERADTRKGAAAFAELRTAVRLYNDRQLAAAADAGEIEDADAFPVVVALEYASRTGLLEGSAGSDGGDGGGGDGDDGSGDGGSDDGDGGGGGLGGGFGSDGQLSAPAIGGGGVAGTGGTGAPGAISPPFPFQSLVLAFLFIVPMNFVVQAYGSTIVDERVNRRGELLLVAPVTRGDIVAGKTLPYFLGLLAVSAGIAAAVGGGVASLAAVAPIALLFLAATFVGAMFARSFKELTFVTIAVSVFLTAYVFVPAIFADVTPIALISPLTLVVRDLRGVDTAVLEYAYSTGPFYLSSMVLFALGGSVYREEDMFTQKPIGAKALDAIATFVHSAKHVAGVTMALLPFVFVAELLVVALVFPMPALLALPVLLLSVALVEELAKSAAAYAGFTHDRFADDDRAALAVGIAAGVGFFLAEKATLVVQLVGLGQYQYGQAAFSTLPAGAGPLAAGVLLLLPLGLHVVTATVTALGARRGARGYAAGVALAVVFHLVYNLGVFASA